MLLAALETPDGSEFVNHPDFRTVSAFFFGWVFYASLSALLSSLQLKGIVMNFCMHLVTVAHRPPPIRNSIVKMSMSTTSSLNTPSSATGANLQCTLIRMLYISFVTGSLANFGSLLSFRPDEELCAFSVAWGNLSTETARLMGLLVLLLTLRHLGMKRFELIISLAWLMVGLAFVFIEAAFATGVARTIQGLSTSPCLRRHSLPPSVVSSTMYFILELFVILRLWFRLPHDQLYPQRKWARLLDIRMLRAMSLVLLNLLTAVPSAIVTSILVESIPYSIGAIGVLLTFSYEVDDWEFTNRQDSPDLSPSSAPSSGYSISGREDAHFSAPAYPAWVPHHPYSARSLSNPAILQTWDDQRPVARTTTLATARSTRTIDSRTARSIRDAVIHQARREKLSGADDGYVSPRLQSDAEAIESNPAVDSPRHVKPVRPKLVIVTRTHDSWPVCPATQTECGRSPPINCHNSVPSGNPEDKMPSSRFSSPSLTTSESRSTITYPSRVLSFSSVPNPDSLEVQTTSISQSSTESRPLESQDFRPGAMIATNPELLGPPPAAPSGPRSLGA